MKLLIAATLLAGAGLAACNSPKETQDASATSYEVADSAPVTLNITGMT